MALDLFAGISVSDYQRALTWYERLPGSPPSFMAHATEAVWELAERRTPRHESAFVTRAEPPYVRVVSLARGSRRGT